MRVFALTLAALALSLGSAAAQQPWVSNDMNTREFISRCGSGELSGNCRDIIAHSVDFYVGEGICPGDLPGRDVLLSSVYAFMKSTAADPSSQYEIVQISVAKALHSTYACQEVSDDDW